MEDYQEKLKQHIWQELPGMSHRPKVVLTHILEHGQVTTEELSQIYGYQHPPRAIRDVRELGIPLESFPTTGADGRRISGYRLPTAPTRVRSNLRGRRQVSNKLRDEVYEKQGGRCAACPAEGEVRYFQVDHRVPYEIAGDKPRESLDDYMMLCAPCNRAKSWSCEHCRNWTAKEPEVCLTCYWAHPDEYDHVAMEQTRRLTLVVTYEEDIEVLDSMKRESQDRDVELAELVMERLKSR